MEKAALKGIFASGNMPAGTEYKAALIDILQTFPYFQLAQVLLAKQMYDTHEPEASMRVKLASVYAPDRKAMYQLFKPGNTLPEGQQPPLTTDKPQANATGKEGVKYNFVYSPAIVKKTETVQTAGASIDSGQTEAFIRKESETKLQNTPVAEKNTAVAAQKEEKTVREIKKTTPVAQPPIKKPISFPSIKPIAPAEKTGMDKKPEEKKAIPLKPSIVERPAVLIKNEPVPIEIKKVENPEQAPVNEPLAKSRLKYSFTEWLKALPEINTRQNDTLKFVNQKEKANIINNFLENLPSISRPKAEFFSPVKAAKMSITEDNEIVSETLANIYLKQGNLQKAVKAYETLLERFPEKKNIFAPRMEEIRALIRENTKK